MTLFAADQMINWLLKFNKINNLIKETAHWLSRYKINQF